MKLASGVKLKTYTLDELLGLGAAGEVWRAHDASKTVAIKFMNPKLLEGDGAEKHRLRLQREVESLTRLQHPNVPTLYDYDMEAERPYLVMRFIGGDTYDKLLTRGKMLQISIGQRLHMVSELAQALSAAHQLGIVHRDVKPSNMIGIENPYLLDFGISLKAENLEQTMRNVGTALYMAPDDPPDELSDNFSFALVTYEILFGTHPIFVRGDLGSGPFAVYTRFLAGERIKNRQWRIPSKVAANELPPDLRGADLVKLDGIFEKALGERSGRYTDLRQFVDDLTQAIPFDPNAPAAPPPASEETAVQSGRETAISEDQFTMLQANEAGGHTDLGADQPKRRLDPRLMIALVAVILVIIMAILLISKG